MKKTTLVGILAAPLMAFAMSLPAWAADGSSAATTCKDGTTSTATGRGACSGHGGVQKASKSRPATAAEPAAAAPAAAAAAPAAGTAMTAAAPAAAGNTNPAGATAKCKDGTYSKSQHRTGTCSKHGGVADWLGAQ